MRNCNVIIVGGAAFAGVGEISEFIARHNSENMPVVFVENEIAHELCEPEPYLLKPSPIFPELLTVDDFPERKLKQHHKVRQYHQRNVFKQQLRVLNKNRKR